MGTFLTAVGTIIAIIGLFSGLFTTTVSAPQQTVAHLDIAIGVLGLVLMGLGSVCYQLGKAEKDRKKAAAES
jgi:hypothetical protein